MVTGKGERKGLIRLEDTISTEGPYSLRAQLRKLHSEQAVAAASAPQVIATQVGAAG